MTHAAQTDWIAFSDSECIACGKPQEMVIELKSYVDAHPLASITVFDATTSHPVEIDLRGDLSSILARLPFRLEPIQTQSAIRAPGRPKLGVIPREITLLPRHWEWLARQPGGASVALRKLVQAAIDVNSEVDRKREMTESAYRFMTAVAGNERGYEEANRALFAGDLKRLAGLVANWPLDVQAQLFKLLAPMIDAQA